MKNKTIAVIGIGSYILSVMTSAEDLEGNSLSPIVLIAISGILTVLFVVAATVRLWKGARHVSIILSSSAAILFILSIVQGIASPSYGSPIIILLNITKVANFIAFIWAVSRLWTMAKYEGLAKKHLEDFGLTPGDVSLVQEDLRKGNREAAVQRLATVQERQRTKVKEATGIDPFAIVPVIGRDIKWTDIVRHVFRVLEFDRADTTVLADGSVKAATRTEPYGYLLVESPILNVKTRLPIIHRDDCALAATVYDEPRWVEVMTQAELLVTYFPKHKLPMGFAGTTRALHYIIVPRGTLERYYEFNDDEHMANPAPEKLFKEFAWDGEIRVQVNSAPKF